MTAGASQSVRRRRPVGAKATIPAAPASARDSTRPACPAGVRPPPAHGRAIRVTAKTPTVGNRRGGSTRAMILVLVLPVETVLPRPVSEGAEIDSQQLRRARLDAVCFPQRIPEEGLFDVGDHLFEVEPSGRNL